MDTKILSLRNYIVGIETSLFCSYWGDQINCITGLLHAMKIASTFILFILSLVMYLFIIIHMSVYKIRRGTFKSLQKLEI